MSEPKKRKPSRGNRAAEKYAKKLKAADGTNNDWVRRAPQAGAEFEFDSDPIEESPTPEHSGDDDGVSWPSEDEMSDGGGVQLSGDTQAVHNVPTHESKKSPASAKKSDSALPSKLETSMTSRAKQKAVTQERKAGKANAELVARAKKIWERLRLGALPSAERKQLVEELFGIVMGRIKDFVLKHDAGRVVQTAIKYGNTLQRRMIAEELRGEYRQLAASKYAKFTIGKLLSYGDEIIRDAIVPEFYGHVRGLIKHPEGGWILDDIYRGAATKAQKSILLREWYGAEFSVFGARAEIPDNVELKDILNRNPEKRSPILKYLFEMINSMVQKRTTGFTILHDAMLQYYLNIEPEGEQAKAFMEMIIGDEEGDLLKNMAFTASGARTVSLLIAHGSAKARKLLLRVYKGHIDSLAFDRNGHQVLLTALEAIDDTVLTSKSIYGELLPAQDGSIDGQCLERIQHLHARIPILLPFVHKDATVLTPGNKSLMAEIHAIRANTSKKDPLVRSRELITSTAPRWLSFIARQPAALIKTAFGCVFIQEVLLSSPVDLSERTQARDAIIALLAAEEKRPKEHTGVTEGLFDGPAATRLLKTLVYSGHFNTKLGKVELCESPLGFGAELCRAIVPNNQAGEDALIAWAIGVRSFVVEAMLRSDDMPPQEKQKIRAILQKRIRELREVARAASHTPTKDKSPRPKAHKPASRPSKGGSENLENGHQDASTRIGSKGAAALLGLIEG